MSSYNGLSRQGGYRNYGLALCAGTTLLQWVVIGDPISPVDGCAGGQSGLSPAAANIIAQDTDSLHEGGTSARDS
eukprot:SAG22_NODE_17665_length_300_cov_1.462687_1_plen_74_part_10